MNKIKWRCVRCGTWWGYYNDRRLFRLSWINKNYPKEWRASVGFESDEWFTTRGQAELYCENELGRILERR
jgi:hypothetical protein